MRRPAKIRKSFLPRLDGVAKSANVVTPLLRLDSNSLLKCQDARERKRGTSIMALCRRITTSEAPIPTIGATDPIADEWLKSGSRPGAVTISRTGDTAAALTVNVYLGNSTASKPQDYTIAPMASATTVVIPSGQASLTLIVTPKTDTLVE